MGLVFSIDRSIPTKHVFFFKSYGAELNRCKKISHRIFVRVLRVTKEKPYRGLFYIDRKYTFLGKVFSPRLGIDIIYPGSGEEEAILDDLKETLCHEVLHYDQWRRGVVLSERGMHKNTQKLLSSTQEWKSER